MTGNDTLAKKKALIYTAKSDLRDLEDMSVVEAESKYTREEFRKQGIVYVRHFFKADECVFPDGKIVLVPEAEAWMDNRLAMTA